MADRHSAASSDRLERALAAFLRQELSAPVVSMQGFLDIIAEDAKRLRLDGAIADLDRMRAANGELAELINRVIDAPDVMRQEHEDFDSFQSRLRHDLRTPLNAIKGYSELLAEDMADGASQELMADLEKVRALADDLLAQIDVMVERTRAPGGDGASAEKPQRFEIVSDVLRAVAPVTEAEEAIPREFASRILVVDDIASNRDLLSRRLLREGHQVETASDGAAALNRLVSEEFDLILLDLMMPGMSGFEVLCRLKASSRTRHIPVIMISALNELDATVRCIEAGAEDYIPKPFNPVLLRARIGACLEKKWLRDREQLHLEELRVEKQRSESLLLKILPHSVVTRMRNGETLIADQFAEVSILFADLVGFTALATRLPPGRVLDILSTVFSHFDRAVADRGLEKIKTIGDAYMVAGGLPVAASDHACRVADLALEMLDIMNMSRGSLQIDLQARIGIHTGPVVAGVIGTHKFIYDVWGDTVNTASRMETFGAPGQIHVSAETRHTLGSGYAFEPRGPLDIKGKGVMDTYFLLGTRMVQAGA
jgi:class 3 adenylate cyclase/CheY-like chemotaxis protein